MSTVRELTITSASHTASTSDLMLGLSAAEALVLLDALDTFHDERTAEGGADNRFRGEACRAIAARLRARATRNDSTSITTKSLP